MAWREKHGDLEYGSKDDKAGMFWTSPALKGNRSESTRRNADGTVSHYRHEDGKIEGYRYNPKTGATKRFEKKDHR
jgi:hypothetical protein